ncbi:hypothetical protein EV361DRAFT_871669 [Lentinula raphanica]|nr:hypothetical protein EV361DRAFT_871669 [Lentinula raphanica]
MLGLTWWDNCPFITHNEWGQLSSSYALNLQLQFYFNILRIFERADNKWKESLFDFWNCFSECFQDASNAGEEPAADSELASLFNESSSPFDDEDGDGGGSGDAQGDGGDGDGDGDGEGGDDEGDGDGDGEGDGGDGDG